MKRALYIVLSLLLMAGCSEEPPQPSSMILEGWIDSDGFPTVLIHKSYILASAPDTIKSLEEIIEGQLIPFGRVAVSDGTEEVVLTGRLDTAYMPPYTYSSVYMMGEEGKTYTVTATYRDLKATATTTIPPKATLDSLSIRASELGMVNVEAYMSHIDTLSESYYALFARQFGTKQYKLCPFGVFTSRDATHGALKMSVYNPILKSEGFQGIANYFQPTDSADYQLKVARIDYPSYQFWKAFNEMSISKGLFFVPVYKNLPSNVSGGSGIFTGMGSSIYRFSLLKDTTYCY